MACIFQQPARFNTFTIADNVFLGDVDKARDDTLIDSALVFANFDGADKKRHARKKISEERNYLVDNGRNLRNCPCLLS